MPPQATPTDMRHVRRVCRAVCRAAGAGTVEEFFHPSRGASAMAYRRRLAMYIIWLNLGGPYAAAGKPFGRCRTAARHAVRAVQADPRAQETAGRVMDILRW